MFDCKNQIARGEALKKESFLYFRQLIEMSPYIHSRLAAL